MIRRPPRSTLFPSTPLSRSGIAAGKALVITAGLNERLRDTLGQQNRVGRISAVPAELHGEDRRRAKRVIPRNSVLVRPIFIEVTLAKNSRDIPRGVDVAEPSPKSVLLAELLVDAHVETVGRLYIRESFGVIPPGSRGIRSQRSVEQVGHRLHVRVDEAGRQKIAGRADGLVLQLGSGD